MSRVIDYILNKIVKTGDLKVTYHTGRTSRFGDGSGPPVHIRFASRAAEWAVLSYPELKVGETFMDGTLIVEEGTIYDFLMIVLARESEEDSPWWIALERRLGRLLRRLHQMNRKGKAKSNVAHHYDLSGELYDLFLDGDRQYSCAYFEDDSVTLEEAQLAKKRHLAAKMYLEKGQRVLDIGSGWGGMGLYLAETHPVTVTGVTLSEEQHALSQQRVKDRGMADRVEFRLQDYRAVPEKFDRIVSVGMFEHVGVGHYREFFEKVRDLLTDDGVMMLHSIGRFDPPGRTNPWIQKYIFPGGYIPAMSEVISVIEETGLLITDIEILRLHYAKTLAEWRRRFMANRDRVLEIYDERFCRMWEFYLAGSEVNFRNQSMMNFQIQISKKLETVPLTRRYIDPAEDALKARDGDLIPGQETAAE